MQKVFLLLLLLGACICDGGKPFKLLNPPDPNTIEESKVIFWDLDHTLYSQATGVYSSALVLRYMEDAMGLEKEEAKRLFAKYNITHKGQVVAGLQEDFGVDPAEFESWIDKKADLINSLAPTRRQLKKTFGGLSARNWIITNSGWGHASRVIDALGIKPHIEAVIFLEYGAGIPSVLKPKPEAFINAMVYAQVDDPTRCYLVDDIEDNAQGACMVGWNAVHFCEPVFCVKAHTKLYRRWDSICSAVPTLASITELSEQYPELKR